MKKKQTALLPRYLYKKLNGIFFNPNVSQIRYIGIGTYNMDFFGYERLLCFFLLWKSFFEILTRSWNHFRPSNSGRGPILQWRAAQDFLVLPSLQHPCCYSDLLWTWEFLTIPWTFALSKITRHSLMEYLAYRLTKYNYVRARVY